VPLRHRSKALSNSRAARTSNTCSSTPNACAPLCSSGTKARAEGLSGLSSTAIRDAWGTVSLSNSNRFPLSSGLMDVSPVRFPPGRATLAMSPFSTGALTSVKTMGIVVVAALAAVAVLFPSTTSTSTWSPTNSAASAGSRSVTSSADRCSMTRLVPSI